MKNLYHIFQTVLAPLIAIVLLMLSNGFFLSFTSMRLSEIGYAEWIIGLVHSAYYAGMLVGASRAEASIARIGHIRAYAAYAGISTGCLMMMGLFPSALAWGVLRFVIGFCLAVFYIVVESWFLSKATVTTRGTILALYMLALYLSSGCSQFILNWIDLSHAEPFLYAGLFGALSAVPLAWTKSASPLHSDESGHSLRSLFSESRFGFSGCVIAGIILSSIYSFTPLFAQHIGLPVSLAVSSCIFGGVALQWPLGLLSDYWDRRKVLLAVSVFNAVSAASICWFYENNNLIYSLLFIQGGFAFTLYPLSITQVCDRLQPEDLTKATGMLLLAYGIGAVIGPPLASLFIDRFAPYGLFPFVGTASITLSLVGINSMLRNAPVPTEEQGHYVPLPNATAVAYELDPRQDEE